MMKTDLLLQMLEQPQQYTADEWREILADEECRELYTLMSKTQSAVDADRADREITDEMIDAEWQHVVHERRRVKHALLYKFAAMFAGILMLSGITFAAIQWWGFVPSPRSGGSEYVQMADTTRQQTAPAPERGEEGEVVTFDNVPLDSMLLEMADHYRMTVDFRRDESRLLRLHFVWKHSESLNQVVERLNNFEAVNIVCTPETLIVK
jgi:hypothetical protein